MARTITDEEIKLSIIINGNPAQKQLIDLEKATRKLTEENKELHIQKRRLEEQGKKETTAYKELTATIKVNNTAIDNNKASMKELQNQIGITGLTMGQLRDKANMLRLTLKNLIPNSADYKKYDSELKQVNNRIAELSGKAQASKMSLSSMADGFNKYQALAFSFIATLTGVVLSIQKIIDYNSKLSDSQANVMKTTGMNKKEVDELTKSFGLLQTRTSRIDLLNIAEQGGRIGIAKDEIAAFVEVMNKANVALGDSFTGGVEEVATKLGKLKFLFKETKDMGIEQAYNSIGSAINELGANGVASEVNITEFATRLGSLPDVLKPTIKEALALGAAFEESGIEAEISSRAYNIFMKQAASESGKFAKVMGVSKQAVEDMINTNPLDFMLKFAEGMRGMDATETAKTLDYLGVNADGANKVIGAMGNNFARFKELIDLSNNSFIAGTSLIKEYNVKNETLGATLDKIRKTVAGWFSSDTFVKWLSSSINFIAKFIGATEDADSSVAKWRNTFAFVIKIIGVLITSMISYSAATRVAALVTNGISSATILFNLALKAQTFWLSLQKVGLLIYTSVMGFFGIATDKASASLARLNLVSKLSPWGALLGLITAVVAAYVLFSDSTKKVVTAQETFAKQMTELNKASSKSTAETKANIASLISLVKDESISMSTRKKAYEDLIKISPIFNGFLKAEKFNIAGLVAVYDEYLTALDRVAYARQFNKLNEGNLKKQIDAENRLFNAEKNYQTAKKAYDENLESNRNKRANDIDFSLKRDLIGKWKAAQLEVKNAKDALTNANSLVIDTNTFRSNKIKELDASITAGEKHLTQIADKSSVEFKKATLSLQSNKAALEAIIGKAAPTPTTSAYHVVTEDEKNGPKKDPNSSEAELIKLRLEEQIKFNDAYLKNIRQLENDRIEAMKDGYDKQVLLEDLRYKREIEDLEAQKLHKEQLVKLDEDIAKAKKDKDISRYNTLLEIKQKWGERNIELDAQIDKIIESKKSLHNINLGVIEEKAASDKIKKTEETHQREKAIRQTAFNEELAGVTTLEQAKLLLKDSLSKKQLAKIDTLEKAKATLQEQFNKEELKKEVDFLNELMAKLDAILNSKQFEGIDLELLTPEQKDIFKKQIEDARKLHSEFMKALGKEDEGDDSDKKARNSEAKEKFLNLNGGVDILGFSAEDWSNAYKNIDTFYGKLLAGTMVVMALQNAWGQYNQILTMNENSRLRQFEMISDKKKAKLKQQLDAGFLSQSNYDRQVKKIDKEYAMEKAALEYRQAKRQKTMAIVDVVIKTAMAIMQGYAQLGPIGGTIAAVLIGTLGALQINAIRKQPLPSATGAEKGIYGDYVRREQDGKVFKSSGTLPMRSGLYSKPTVLVGEGPGDSPEMVIDKRAFQQISPAVKNALIRELRGIKGFEDGYYNQDRMRYEVSAGSSNNSSNNSDVLLQMALNVIAENAAVMKDLRDKGVMGKFYTNDLQSARNIKKSITDYENLRNDNKL